MYTLLEARRSGGDPGCWRERLWSIYRWWVDDEFFGPFPFIMLLALLAFVATEISGLLK
jgi:hypothetical protein